MTNTTATMPYESPVGRLVLECDGDVLIGVWLPNERRHGRRDVDDVPPVLKDAAAQLDEFFTGERRDFDVPMELDGTDFQLEVWSELTRIPYGETISYGELARRVGRPSAPPRRGSGQRAQPHPDHRAVPSGGGQQRDRRIRRRFEAQARPPCLGGCHGLTRRVALARLRRISTVTVICSHRGGSASNQNPMAEVRTFQGQELSVGDSPVTRLEIAPESFDAGLYEFRRQRRKRRTGRSDLWVEVHRRAPPVCCLEPVREVVRYLKALHGMSAERIDDGSQRHETTRLQIVYRRDVVRCDPQLPFVIRIPGEYDLASRDST